jgi:hypothetical protein
MGKEEDRFDVCRFCIDAYGTLKQSLGYILEDFKQEKWDDVLLEAKSMRDYVRDIDACIGDPDMRAMNLASLNAMEKHITNEDFESAKVTLDRFIDNVSMSPYDISAFCCMGPKKERREKTEHW